MNINQPVALNLSADGIPPRLHMIQGDSNTRTIVATLWDGAQSYKIPSGASIMLRFKKPDGTGGLYDTTEGGKSITFSGSTVTVPVATQVLSVAGTVFAEVDIYGTGSGKTAEKLSTFLLTIEVDESVYPDAQIISSDYYNVLTGTIATAVTAAQNAAASATAAAASAASAATSVAGAVKYNAAQSLTVAQKQQARDNIGVNLCNPNLIDNGYFKNPVNRRGQTVYTGAAYTIDRWKGTNSAVKVTLTSNGLTLTTTDSTKQPFLAQPLERIADLLGKMVTLSAITTQGALFYATATLPETLPDGTVGYCAVDNVFDLLAQNGNSLSVRLKSSVGGAIALLAGKLEFGPEQTLAHKNADGKWVLNEIPNKAIETIKCACSTADSADTYANKVVSFS